jgi:hypothetical protein
MNSYDGSPTAAMFVKAWRDMRVNSGAAAFLHKDGDLVMAVPAPDGFWIHRRMSENVRQTPLLIDVDAQNRLVYYSQQEARSYYWSADRGKTAKDASEAALRLVQLMREKFSGDKDDQSDQWVWDWTPLDLRVTPRTSLLAKTTSGASQDEIPASVWQTLRPFPSTHAPEDLEF